LKKIVLFNLNNENPIDMKYMFHECYSLNELTIPNRIMKI